MVRIFLLIPFLAYRNGGPSVKTDASCSYNIRLLILKADTNRMFVGFMSKFLGMVIDIQSYVIKKAVLGFIKGICYLLSLF